MKHLFFTMALLLITSQGIAIEALVYKQVSRRTQRDALGTERAEVLHQTIYAVRNALRTETVEITPVTIVRLDEGTIYQFDEVKKIYAAAPIDMFSKDVERYKEMLRTVYGEMPREKQERLAVVLGKVKARAKVLEEGRNIIIAGLPTKKLAFYENGLLRTELWVSDKYKVETDMAPLLEATGEFSSALLGLLKKERGIALKSRVHPVLEIHPAVENEVTEITRRDVSDSLFRMPEGYKKVEAIETETGRAGGTTAETVEAGKTENQQTEAGKINEEINDAPLP